MNKKGLIIAFISFVAAIVLAVFLYITFHILFIFLFLPLAFIGPFFGGRSNRFKDKFHEESERFYRDFKESDGELLEHKRDEDGKE